MIAITITQRFLALSFDELVALSYFKQEFLLRHHASIVSASTAVLEVLRR